MPESHHAYIGDGVYVCLEQDDIRLTTGHHHKEHATNVIILDQEVWHNLLLWAKNSITYVSNKEE